MMFAAHMPRRLRFFMFTVATLLLLAGGGYLLIFNWLVPKTAIYAIPMRWNRMPLRTPKSIVHGYFGEPAIIQPHADLWVAGTKSKQYQLRISYLADSIATAYSIRYRYSSRLVTREYLLDSASIR